MARQTKSEDRLRPTVDQVKIEEIPEELPQYAQIDELAEGLKAWTNPQNGYRVLRLHCYADPIKRTDAYQKEASQGMPRDKFLREFHLVWRSFEGRPVYLDDWNRNFHISKEVLKWAPHLPILRGWDFGLTPACIFAQLMPDMRLFVLREICEEEMGLERFLDVVTVKSREWFPNPKRYVDIIDPAGFVRGQTDERSCMSIMSGTPWFLKPVPGRQNPVERRNHVVKFLQRNVRGLPCFFVSPLCKGVISGFDGGYLFAYNRAGQLREQPNKNLYSHPHDALQYICTRVFDVDLSTRDQNIVIAQPTYKIGVK
ncbi:MAG: hypothetical protein L0Y56_10980 [Nitrospira sp.]|nr:hypothetical protein [Nitrospira sp.]